MSGGGVGDELVVIDDQDDTPSNSTLSSVSLVEKLVNDLDKRLVTEVKKDERKRARSTKKGRASGGGERSRQAWTKGTGFGGHGGGRETELGAKVRADKAEAADKEDEDVGRILNSLSEAIQVAGEPEPIMAVMARARGLSRTLQNLLRNESLLDVGSRTSVYTPLLSFLSALASRRDFWPMLLAPLHRKGWGSVKDLQGARAGAVRENGGAEPQRGSQRGRRGKERKEKEDREKEEAEADKDEDEDGAEEGETVGALLGGLKVQAKLFVAMCE
eukprot:CAMPEP_0177710364 /NCGR_PEP_ID=MMETSP0484_2-20121128/11293_1 /TAXON_ID=354590 /ORGANISM="Rhodomonas lens, Strain RHODO" /LENGTH=273 /DNA_ID=CAMNT_0019222035 /DNA_START=180 /DNA_END=998 /DNA_ORIENTATION=-